MLGLYDLVVGDSKVIALPRRPPFIDMIGIPPLVTNVHLEGDKSWC